MAFVVAGDASETNLLISYCWVLCSSGHARLAEAGGRYPPAIRRDAAPDPYVGRWASDKFVSNPPVHTMLACAVQSEADVACSKSDAGM